MATKPTLVILPGWGGSHETWQEFIALASTHFAVVCIDLPCFGDEPCPKDVWGVEEYAEFVRDKITDIRGTSDHLVILGHSFGGQVATCLVSKYPKLADKLILAGAAVVRPNKIVRRAVFGMIAKIGNLFFRLPIVDRFDAIGRKILYRLINSPDYQKTAGIKRDIYKKIIRQDFSASLREITIPTLVVWGDRDRMTPLRHGKRIAAMLPHSTLHLYRDTGHGIHHDRTKEFVEDIVAFIR